MRLGIDLDGVVAEMLEMLDPVIQQRGALVQVIGRLPKVTGDPTLIGMAISNLVSNGLKFNDRTEPHVEIGCLPTEPPTIYVRDNGIGIDKKHLDFSQNYVDPQPVLAEKSVV